MANHESIQTAQSSVAESNRIFAVKLQGLPEIERKSYANNMLHCFAALRNQWSTYEELEHFYKILKPWLDRSPIKNIKENICDWNRHMKKEGLGDNHANDDSDECIIKDIHRVCKKQDAEGVEYFRVHPKIAPIVFAESDNTVDDIKPLSVRMTKRKREEEEDVEGLSGHNEMYRKVQRQVMVHRKIMRRMRNKIEEVKKTKKEYRESMHVLCQLEEEMQNHAADAEKIIKTISGKKGKRILAREREHKQPKQKEQVESNSSEEEDSLNDDEDESSEQMNVEDALGDVFDSD